MKDHRSPTARYRDELNSVERQAYAGLHNAMVCIAAVLECQARELPQGSERNRLMSLQQKIRDEVGKASEHRDKLRKDLIESAQTGG